MNSKHIWWFQAQTYQKVVQKLTDIVGSISLVSLVVWQNITWLNFHKIQNFICIQTCDSPNFRKPERKRTFLSTQNGVRRGILKIWHVFVDSIILKNRSIVHFGGWWKWQDHLLVIFCGRHKWVTSKTITISKKEIFGIKTRPTFPKF